MCKQGAIRPPLAAASSFKDSLLFFVCAVAVAYIYINIIQLLANSSRVQTE